MFLGIDDIRHNNEGLQGIMLSPKCTLHIAYDIIYSEILPYREPSYSIQLEPRSRPLSIILIHCDAWFALQLFVL